MKQGNDVRSLGCHGHAGNLFDGMSLKEKQLLAPHYNKSFDFLYMHLFAYMRECVYMPSSMDFVSGFQYYPYLPICVSVSICHTALFF